MSDLQTGYDRLTNLYRKSQIGLIPPSYTLRQGAEPKVGRVALSSPVYVLMDRGCGSSCELMLEAFEKLPMVETVGENSTGVVQFGEVGYLFLPESHIVIHMPTQGSRYSDKRVVEKIGYAPRRRVPSGQDALKFAVANFFAFK